MATKEKDEGISYTHDPDTEVHDAAGRGHTATDKYVNSWYSYPRALLRPCTRYGRSLVHLDPEAEAKLRLKIDLMVVPTVALLYLFCFIDRANIGKVAEPPWYICGDPNR